MQSIAKTPDEYIAEVPLDRQEAMQKLRNIIQKNLPTGFEERMQYGMITYVVPHSIYPKGYHCKPSEPLPFISLASQKNTISLYLMGLYSNKGMLEWFLEEYPKHTKAKLDMGKSCVRWNKPEDIPYDLIGTLAQKITPQEGIDMYESKYGNKK